MRQVVLYIASSLDGFIATRDGGVDWLHNPDFEIEGEDYGYKMFYDSIGTTLMGHNTYKKILEFDVPFPYPDKINFVFSRSKQLSEDIHVKFVSDDIVDFVRGLKSQQGSDIWLVGGGQVNTVLLNASLIDKIILTICPVVLGSGIPLFTDRAVETHFKLQTNQYFESGLVQLTYTSKA